MILRSRCVTMELLSGSQSLKGAEGSQETASLDGYDGPLLGRGEAERTDTLGKVTSSSCRETLGAKRCLFLEHTFGIYKISNI